MTKETFTEAVRLQREFESCAKDKMKFEELSSNMLLQAESYGCGTSGNEIAKTLSECIKIFVKAKPEYTLDLCSAIVAWSDAKAKQCAANIENIKKEVEEL